MKKNLFMALVCLMTMIVATSCSSDDPKAKIQSNLEQVVIEKGMGFITKCSTISMSIDTVRVSDVKCFIEKHFPDGVPSDYEDEYFEKFISPVKSNNNDNSIVYLSVTHKYKIFMKEDPFKRDEVIVTAYRLIDPNSYEYISDDITKDESWTGDLEYNFNKAFEEALNNL